MFWKILGIEPTTNKREIDRAYREKLVNTNPEDKPEEFMELRNAYEEALRYLESQKSESTEEKTALQLWRDKLSDIYADFKKRNSVDEWKKLMSEDICQTIDTRMMAEDELFKFLMDNYFITHDVWVYLDEEFHFVERQEELSERYPRDFVEYVLVNGVSYGDTLPMNMFIPGVDGECCQKYLGIYLKARKANGEEAKKSIDEMLSLPEQHPYGNAIALSYQIFFEDKNKVNDLIELQKQYSDDTFIALVLINELFHLERYEEDIQICEQLLQTHPDHGQLKWHYAMALAETGKNEEAITQLNDLLRNAGGDQQNIYEIDMKRRELSLKVIEEKKAKLAENPDDDEVKIDLAWAYLENYQDKEAEEVTRTLRKENVDAFNYYNLMSNIAFSFERYDEALEDLNQLIETIKNLPEDGDEDTRKKKGRLGEMYGRLGYYYYVLKDNEKSMEAYEIALKTAKDKALIITQLCQGALKERNYSKLVEYAKMLLKEKPDAYHAYLFLGYGYYYQRYDNEAFDALNRGLDLCKTDLELYILKIRVLINNKAYPEAKEIIDFLLNNKLEDDPSVQFVEGLYQQFAEGNEDKAIEMYEKADETLGENAVNFTFTDEMYYRLLCLKGDKLNAGEQADREQMLKIAEKGLAVNPNYYGLLDYKAWVLTRGKQYDEALEIYMKLLDNPRHGPAIEAQIGYIYYQDLKHKADQSLQYYLKSLENGGDYAGHFYAGMCYMYMGDLDNAEKHFIILQENEPKELDSYYRMSFINEMRFDNKEALRNINKTIGIINMREGNQSYYYYRKVQILRRMGNVEQAVETVREMQNRYNTSYADKLICEIYFQFGMFEEAQKHLKAWKKRRNDAESRFNCEITLEMLNNNMFMAKLSKANVDNLLNANRRMELDCLFARNNGKFSREVKLLENWLKEEEQKENGDLSRIYGTLSYAYFHLGDHDKQLYYANIALEVLDEKLNEYGLSQLLYLTRKARALALADRKEEALELVERCRKHPLCEDCPYRSCKDMDLYEAEMEEIFGNEAKALELMEKGNEKWPDEEEFVIAKNFMKKKV